MDKKKTQLQAQKRRLEEELVEVQKKLGVISKQQKKNKLQHQALDQVLFLHEEDLPEAWKDAVHSLEDIEVGKTDVVKSGDISVQRMNGRLCYHLNRPEDNDLWLVELKKNDIKAFYTGSCFDKRDRSDLEWEFDASESWLYDPFTNEELNLNDVKITPRLRNNMEDTDECEMDEKEADYGDWDDAATFQYTRKMGVGYWAAIRGYK